LWRAVDQDGDVLDILVQNKRDKKAGLFSLHYKPLAGRKRYGTTKDESVSGEDCLLDADGRLIVQRP
jgi:hypothetical protein